MTTRLELIPFFDHCKKSGVFLELGDVSFICQRCEPYPYADIRTVLFKYVQVWQDAKNRQKNPIKRDNFARFTANTWLRENLDD